MKAVKQYQLYFLATSEHVYEILKSDDLNESYLAVIVFPEGIFFLQKVVLTFESVHKIPKCDDSNESYTEQYFHVLLFIML